MHIRVDLVHNMNSLLQLGITCGWGQHFFI